ncbi:5-oxoprolinase subunit PxpA [Oceanospirillum sp.]|uniref:5-oxoprolinase subunit PxpA n=1 Tax=Oceanospirillum sp. TaxID=2021254 RepID=UPI003A8CC6E1
MLLNCDLGESFGSWTMGLDADVMPLIDQANIACGFHASDPLIMQKTVQLALSYGVSLGAHPAYPDLQGFGRRSMACAPEEITAMVLYQIGALQNIAASEGGQLSYVKPHGALYNDMMRDPKVLDAILLAVKKTAMPLALMAMSTADNQYLKRRCSEQQVPLLLEAFADRAYDKNGFIVSRSTPGAVYHQQESIVEQAAKLAEGKAIQTLEDENLILEADTLCVHGDNPESLKAVEAIRAALGAKA